MTTTKAFTAKKPGNCASCAQDAFGQQVVFHQNRITHVTCLPDGVTPRIPTKTPKVREPRPNLAEMSFVAFDTETTGIGSEDRIVTAALVFFTNGEPTRTVEWLIDPEMVIPARATEVHGITTEYAREHGRKEAEVLVELRDALHGQTVVAYNAAFDVRMLHAGLDRHGIEFPEFTVCDPFRWHKEDVKAGPHRLGNACEHHGIELTDWHSASADALAAGLIALKQSSVS